MSALDDFIRQYVPDQPAFSLDEVARITGFPRTQLMDWCRKGLIKHLGKGRQRSVPRPQLIELLQESWVNPQPTQTRHTESPEEARLAAVRDRVARRIAERGAA